MLPSIVFGYQRSAVRFTHLRARNEREESLAFALPGSSSRAPLFVRAFHFFLTKACPVWLCAAFRTLHPPRFGLRILPSFRPSPPLQRRSSRHALKFQEKAPPEGSGGARKHIQSSPTLANRRALPALWLALKGHKSWAQPPPPPPPPPPPGAGSRSGLRS
jgi:hypothetical protein